jgi:hypothetical protein
VPDQVLAAILVPLETGVLRRQQPAGDRRKKSQLVPDSPEFFLTLQLTIDTARVNRDTEALYNSLC